MMHLFKIIVRNCCILFALCVSFIFIPQCYASDSSVNISAPSETTQIWFDIEGTDIKSNKIGVKIDNKDIKFASSPSGITSVVSMGGGSHKLSLNATKQHINQPVFISFVNSNRIVLKESKLTMTLAGGFKIDDYYPNTNTNTNSDASHSDNNDSNNDDSNNSDNTINSNLNSESPVINGSKNNHNNNSNSDSARVNNNSGQSLSSKSENNKHKRFAGMVYITGVGITLILITSIILILFGIGIHFSVNGAHVKREA